MILSTVKISLVSVVFISITYYSFSFLFVFVASTVGEQSCTVNVYARTAGGGSAKDSTLSTDCTQVGATSSPDTTTETVSLVQASTATAASATGARTAPHHSRRRRASMQEALDFTKINTSLYDPTLVHDTAHNTHRIRLKPHCLDLL